MTRNEGALDRTVRVIIGAILLLAWWFGWLSGAVAVILGLIGIILIATGLSGFCPVYQASGRNTCPTEQT